MYVLHVHVVYTKSPHTRAGEHTLQQTPIQGHLYDDSIHRSPELRNRFFLSPSTSTVYPPHFVLASLVIDIYARRGLLDAVISRLPLSNIHQSSQISVSVSVSVSVSRSSLQSWPRSRSRFLLTVHVLELTTGIQDV